MDKVDLFKIESIRKFCLLTLLGSGLMLMGAMVRVPCYPVPITLHTLALFIVALTQSPMQAAASICCYLVIYPFGFFSKSAGYCLAFPIAAYLISYLSNHIRPFFAVLIGQCVIFLLGFLHLSAYVGAETAYFHGVLFFIPSALLKNIIATWIVRRIK